MKLVRRSKSLLVAASILVGTTGCSTVTLIENDHGVIKEDWRWQTGLVGAFSDDMVAHRDDGSCVRVTWNRAGALLDKGLFSTDVISEKPCGSAAGP